MSTFKFNTVTALTTEDGSTTKSGIFYDWPELEK
jgi:hypothetical protein